MRIAWFGPIGEGGGSAGGIGIHLIEAALRAGYQVDYFYSFEEFPERLRQYSNLSVFSTPKNWYWNRWYSSTPILAFLSGTIARINAYNRLGNILMEQHQINPYDCIFQWSQTELFKLGKNLHRLPPIIVFPGVHSAGELRWHRRESAYALQSESPVMHYLVRLFLTYRSWVQQRELQKPSLVLGLSQRFNDLIAADYHIPSERLAVLHHPIALQPVEEIQKTDEMALKREVIKLLFVARISVRKGLQYITELSHRLDDLKGQVQIELIGDRTQWSDYRAHLKDLNSNIATYVGSKKHKDVMVAFEQADILLLPCLYEPGGIVVGEALSRGVCVVTSDAVGSAEVLDGDCHREFSAENMDAFEQAVRQLITDIKTRRQELRDCARQQCQAHFDPARIAQKFITIIEDFIGQSEKQISGHLTVEIPELMTDEERIITTS